jgi:hypothetical protein
MHRLADDTPRDIEQRQIEAWRRMPPSEKLSLVIRLSDTVRELALAGVRQRYPDASPREQFLRLAMVTLGDDLARKAYPEIETMEST